jgi:hypothetical protein
VRSLKDSRPIKELGSMGLRPKLGNLSAEPQARARPVIESVFYAQGLPRGRIPS